MNTPSTQIRSSQRELHPRLDEVVRRHLRSKWKQPLHAPTVGTFKRLIGSDGFKAGRELILDSGCGTGESTRRISDAFPEALVIGVDRSASRLSKLGAIAYPHFEGNAVWVQGVLPTFWRLALKAGWRLKRHYLLYPNPWPKPGHLQRRWHAHPVFGDLLALGGLLEMRCNWRVYANEFKVAIEIATQGRTDVYMESSESEEDWAPVETPFGRKYARSGHTLYRVIVEFHANV